MASRCMVLALRVLCKDLWVSVDKVEVALVVPRLTLVDQGEEARPRLRTNLTHRKMSAVERRDAEQANNRAKPKGNLRVRVMADKAHKDRAFMQALGLVEPLVVWEAHNRVHTILKVARSICIHRVVLMVAFTNIAASSRLIGSRCIVVDMLLI